MQTPTPKTDPPNLSDLGWRHFFVQQLDPVLARLCARDPGELFIEGVAMFIATPPTSIVLVLGQLWHVQGMDQAQLKRLKVLEGENTRLKKIVADQAMDIHALKDLVGKEW